MREIRLASPVATAQMPGESILLDRSRSALRSFALIRLLAAALLVALPAGSSAAGESKAAQRSSRDAARRDEHDGELSARLARVLKRRSLRGARISALVVGAGDERVLFERTPDRTLTPASNTKLLTALAALATFGPTYRFETVAEAPAAIDAQGGVASLIVRGSGDPALNSEDWWRFASELHRGGLRRVRGDLVLDDSAFDSSRWHPDWGPTSSRAYHAPVGALTANYGAFVVTVRPGAEAGSPVDVAISPPVAYLRVANRARTRRSGGAGRLRVDREATSDGELVVVEGSLRVGDPEVVFFRSVLDPTRYAGSVLRLQLEAVGIEIDGRVRVAVPDSGVELMRFKGRSLAEIVRLFMKYSNNAVAESLVKAIGAQRSGEQGSWEVGMPALRETLVGLGLDPKGFALTDGSGLSYGNRVSPRTLVEVLRIGRSSFDFGPELMASLPLASLDGTLAKRAEGAAGQVRAKTGLLTRVTALSGLARLPSGEVCLFSIVLNGYRGSDEEAMDAVDAFIAELVRDTSLLHGG